jgi:hypothetical protein
MSTNYHGHIDRSRRLVLSAHLQDCIAISREAPHSFHIVKHWVFLKRECFVTDMAVGHYGNFWGASGWFHKELLHVNRFKPPQIQQQAIKLD